MEIIFKIWIAYILDLIFGDPENIMHPVQMIGKLIEILEKILINRKHKIIAGGILTLLTVSITYIVSLIIITNNKISIIIILEIYLMYTVFSVNSLAREGNKVYNILKNGDIKTARKELSYLVSRDTDKMDEKMIIRSTMETISENMVDGVISPIFYMFLGGLPLAMTYKAVNTLDSMVGYKNEKYIHFGKIPAKFDDIINFIPARITGILIIFSSFILRYDYRRALKIFLRDRKNHSSPNSAHPESSVAGALGVQFGGSVSYFGINMEKPTIGDKIKDFEIEDIKKNIKLMYVVSFIGMAIFTVIGIIIIKLK